MEEGIALKRLAWIAAAAAVLLGAALMAIAFLFDADQYRRLLESRLSEALGREVRIGALKLELLKGQVAAEDVLIGEDPAFAGGPFLRARSIHIGIALRPLILERKLRVTAVIIERPEVRVALSEGGQWSFASLGRGKRETAGERGRLDLYVSLVRIADGRITLARPGSREQTLENIDLELREISLSSAMDFSFAARLPQGATVKVQGKAGPLERAEGKLPPMEVRFELPAVELKATGLVDASSGLAGLVAANGAIRTQGNIAEATGTVRAERLKLVRAGSPAGRPAELAFTVVHDVARRSGRLTHAGVRIGKAEAALAGSYTLTGAAPSFALKFRGDRMPLTELAAMLPAFNVVLPAGATLESGTLDLQASVAGTLDNFTATGPLRMDHAVLANYDLGVKLRVIQALAGIPATSKTEIQTLSATVKRTGEGTRIENIIMVAPAIGELTGSGVIGADNTLDFQMRTTLHTAGPLLHPLKGKGDTSIPFLVAGTASDPAFKADVRTLAKDQVEKFTKDPDKALKTAKEILELFRRPKARGEAPQQ